MRPPRCDVCDVDAGGDGGLVTFLARDSDREWREAAARDGLVGHPPDTAWLCAEHIRAGRLLATELTIDRALDRLRLPAVTTPRNGASRPSDTGEGVEIAQLVGDLAVSLSAIAAEAGIARPVVETHEKRDWVPMDRTLPPHCPFVDTTTHSASSAGTTVTLIWERSHWNPAEIATTHTVLHVTSAHGGEVTVSAYPPNGSTCVRPEDLTVQGTPGSTAIEVLSALGLTTRLNQRGRV